MADTTYFTCTLGQAAGLNDKSPHEFKTVTEFIDYQAQAYPKAPAIGFPIPPKDEETKWEYIVFSAPYHNLWLPLRLLTIG